MKGIAIGILLAVAIWSCASPDPVRPSPNDRYQLLTQQTALWTQIRDWRREARMPLDPPHIFELQLQRSPVGDARRVCPDNHEVPKTCDDVCNLGDAICDNAEQICKLADELGKDDTFAQDKCTSAKASCREAQQRCCDCSGGGK